MFFRKNSKNIYFIAPGFLINIMHWFMLPHIKEGLVRNSVFNYQINYIPYWQFRAQKINWLSELFQKLVVPLIVPTPLEGEGTIYSNGFFFVQSILADRYIHRRELRLVSLESLSRVEYGIKKIFLIFIFNRELSRFKFRENSVNSVEILFTFSRIFE